MVQKRRLLPIVLSVIIGLGSLWLLTALYGSATIRREFLLSSKLNTPEGIMDLSATDLSKRRIPWFFCRACALAPLVVRVEYARDSGPLGVSQGRSYYLWFFGLTRCLWENTRSS
jgi:hypothetical protein